MANLGSELEASPGSWSPELPGCEGDPGLLDTFLSLDLAQQSEAGLLEVGAALPCHARTGHTHMPQRLVGRALSCHCQLCRAAATAQLVQGAALVGLDLPASPLLAPPPARTAAPQQAAKAAPGAGAAGELCSWPATTASPLPPYSAAGAGMQPAGAAAVPPLAYGHELLTAPGTAAPSGDWLLHAVLGAPAPGPDLQPLGLVPANSAARGRAAAVPAVPMLTWSSTGKGTAGTAASVPSMLVSTDALGLATTPLPPLHAGAQASTSSCERQQQQQTWTQLLEPTAPALDGPHHAPAALPGRCGSSSLDVPGGSVVAPGSACTGGASLAAAPERGGQQRGTAQRQQGMTEEEALADRKARLKATQKRCREKQVGG